MVNVPKQPSNNCIASSNTGTKCIAAANMSEGVCKAASLHLVARIYIIGTWTVINVASMLALQINVHIHILRILFVMAQVILRTW
jgi:hypothetical protein